MNNLEIPYVPYLKGSGVEVWLLQALAGTYAVVTGD